MTVLEGFDISNYQGYPNWKEVGHDKKDFTFIKASEGIRYQDPTFGYNWHNAKAEGLERVAYHFWYDSMAPDIQCNNLHSHVRNNGHFHYGDGIAIDVEEVSVTGAANPVDNLEELVLKCRHDIDKQVIIYTNYDTWVNLLGNPFRRTFGSCPLWLADLSAYIPALKQWPKGLSFLQYTFQGVVPGIAGFDDLDRFFGTRRQLRALLRNHP